MSDRPIIATPHGVEVVEAVVQYAEGTKNYIAILDFLREHDIRRNSEV